MKFKKMPQFGPPPEPGQVAPEDNSAGPVPDQKGGKYNDLHPLIQVENLFLRYGGRTALENISLDIHRGCITALIGPSGCGKTSFLSCINRLSDLIPDC
jgi:phosphate transport system ATP-binding protein